MKAIVCMAGEGKRLRPLTNDRPKGLVEIDEKTILERLLENLSMAGIYDVILVVGYQAHRVKAQIGPTYKLCRITYVFNPDFSTTDNLYSLWLARDHVSNEGFIFFNGDIAFDLSILKRIVESPQENCLAVDDMILLEDDAMKVHCEQGLLKEIGKKIVAPPNGWAIGIYRLSPQGAQRYFEMASAYFSNGPQNISFVVPFGRIANEQGVVAISTSGASWVEIDTPQDYATACLRSNDTKSLLKWFIGIGLDAAQPKKFMPVIVEKLLPKWHNKRIFVVGAGKASASMAAALEASLDPDLITAGMVISNDTSPILNKIELLPGDHPIPSLRNYEATQRMLSMKQTYSIGPDDVVIGLLSGGGSALLTAPVDLVSLPELQSMTQLLLLHGADETELAIVRKKVSKVKAGGLANYFYPTPIFPLIISDVSTNDLSTIASGPFTQDETTYDSALKILEKYNLSDKVAPSILNHLQTNASSSVIPKYLRHVTPHIVADNSSSLKAIEEYATKLGFEVSILPPVYGEAADAAASWHDLLTNSIPTHPTLFLAGGFTSVNVGDAQGQGGRNQEFILSFLNKVRVNPPPFFWGLISFATDGVDFIETSAGGIIDSHTVMLLKKTAMDLPTYLSNHDSYHALNLLNANIASNGPSGTNVCDIIAMLIIP